MGEIDRKAFRNIGCGLFVVGAKEAGGRDCGCVINTLMQVSSKPAQVIISINKENATTRAILSSGRFSVSILSESATMNVIGTFGFMSSAIIDKFANVEHTYWEDVPCLTQESIAMVGVRVNEQVDVGTHIVFVGTVEMAEVLNCEEPMSAKPMTYSYYHEVLKGETPPNAVSFAN